MPKKRSWPGAWISPDVKVEGDTVTAPAAENAVKAALLESQRKARPHYESGGTRGAKPITTRDAARVLRGR